MGNSDVTVGAYYFPNWHTDPLNEAVHGHGWTEWEVVKCARARFPGHRQPRIPLWGYEDESRPDVMARKIAAARQYGIDAFIFDYYYSDEGAFRERALQEGFLKGGNPGPLKFALMWCNHPRQNMHPAPFSMALETYNGSRISEAAYQAMTDHIVLDYFSHPNYWKIHGKPFYAVYSIYQMIRDAGSVDACAKMLDLLRSKTRRAGFPDIHLHVISCFWEEIAMVLNGQTAPASSDPLREWIGSPPQELAERLGINTQSDYAWLCNGNFPLTDSASVMRQISERWELRHEVALPRFLPTVAVGWDPSPRTVQSDMYEPHAYPWCAVWSLTPAEFRTMLRQAEQFLRRHTPENRICLLSAWNEWTEGAYLEPDTFYEYEYLAAIRSVFGSEVSDAHPVAEPATTQSDL